LKRVVTLGEIVVEIMAEEKGCGFREPVTLRGPFPSGAPAIFIDQVGRLGQPCGLIASVGDDDFGWVNIDRLRTDGVDVSAVRIDPDLATGSAFVRYRESGERDFVFNIRHSAAGQIDLTAPARALLAECGHFHMMGSSLFSSRVIAIAKEAVEMVRSRGGSISFDPNIRKEMLNPEMREALGWMLRHCDIFLPSGAELTLLTESEDEGAAVEELLGMGVGCVVAKQGAEGSTYFDRNGRLKMPGFAVTETDPTGAGDCFGATFITCHARAMPPKQCLRYANASGARAVCQRGPMEGASTFEDLDAFIATSAGNAP